jgi:hypothetical protein
MLIVFMLQFSYLPAFFSPTRALTASLLLVYRATSNLPVGFVQAMYILPRGP